MQKRFTSFLYACISAILFVLAPTSALADGASTNNVALPPVLITEFQTGSSTSGKDEFIELYNNSPKAIDITGWQLRYMSAASATSSLVAPTQTITITPQADGSETELGAGAYFILHTSTDALPDGADGQTYNYTLPASSGSVVLFSFDAVTCTLAEDDAVAWGSGAFGQGIQITASTKDADYQRYVDASRQYVESYDNVNDFSAAPIATPAALNTLALADEPSALPAPQQVTFSDSTCTPPDEAGDGSGDLSGLQSPGDDDTPPTVESSTATDSDTPSATTKPSLPAADEGLVSPQLTELLPNPAPPQADAADEFIELYNANTSTFDLSGFKIVVGLTTLHTYTFPIGTELAAHSFAAFFSATTSLSLSNTAGEVILEDPSGISIDKTAPYGTAKDGQAWALDKGSWVWTTTPTPNAPNLITTLATTAAKTTKASAPKVAAKTSTSTKSKVTTKSSAGSTDSTSADLASSTSPAPIHAGVLAFAALFALLYGAYEYRRDVANRFHQLRGYRNARREARASLARRRSG